MLPHCVRSCYGRCVFVNLGDAERRVDLIFRASLDVDFEALSLLVGETVVWDCRIEPCN